MLQTKSDGPVSLGTKALLIATLGLIQWLGSGCQSVEPAASTTAAAPALPSTTRPKPNDFNNIMARLDKTSHAGVRKSPEQTNDSAPVSAAQQRAMVKLADISNTPATPGKATVAVTTAAVKTPESQTQLLPVVAASTRPAPATMTTQTPLIVTNRTPPDAEKIAGTPSPVMTVKARGTNDDEDADERTSAKSYAGMTTAPGQNPPAGTNGSWVQRGVLSLSVGCLGAACFLLRIIRLGRFAGKLVSSGVQVASRLRA